MLLSIQKQPNNSSNDHDKKILFLYRPSLPFIHHLFLLLPLSLILPLFSTPTNNPYVSTLKPISTHNNKQSIHIVTEMTNDTHHCNMSYIVDPLLYTTFATTLRFFLTIPGERYSWYERRRQGTFVIYHGLTPIECNELINL